MFALCAVLLAVAGTDQLLPIDYRALFEKRRGSWYMVTFIAGD